MNDSWLMAIPIFLGVLVIVLEVIRDVKASRRQAPDGKVFVKDFMEMVRDIGTALTDSKREHLDAFMNGNFKFKVRVEKETPHKGLEYETIPMYKSYAIYIDDELVCRAHVIHKYKDNVFFEFSSKRKREEIIDIVKRAHETAKEINHKNISNWIGKYDSKSFYSEVCTSEQKNI